MLHTRQKTLPLRSHRRGMRMDVVRPTEPSRFRDTRAFEAFTSSNSSLLELRRPRECLPLYSVNCIEPRKSIGPARTIDHALLLAEAGGAGRYEVCIVGDARKHLCFMTKHDDGTFTIDPRRAGTLTAALSGTLTRA